MSHRIVVVEDAPATQILIKRTLELAGFEVEVFTDGDSGLACVLANPPDGVIIDIAVPGLDGLEVLRQMRADARTAGVPAIIATAHAGSGIETRAYDLGASAFVGKPFNPIQLQITVRELMGAGA